MIYFWLSFVLLLALVIFLDLQYNLLRDDTTTVLQKKPYSFARAQLTWWSVIVLSAYAAAMFKTGNIPDLYDSTLILLGISGGTFAVARIADVSDQRKLAEGKIQDVHQNKESNGLLIDILSDQNGVSIHRLQTVFFNITIGAWTIVQIGRNIASFPDDCSVLVSGAVNKSCLPPFYPIPDINENNLILLGLSVGVYTALKSSENAKL